MIRSCGSITIWQWYGLLSSFWWMARWTTAERTCSILFIPMVNGLLLASQIRDARIAFAGRPGSRSFSDSLFRQRRVCRGQLSVPTNSVPIQAINRLIRVIGLLAGLFFLVSGSLFLHQMHLDEFLLKLAVASGRVLENKSKQNNPRRSNSYLSFVSYHAIVQFPEPRRADDHICGYPRFQYAIIQSRARRDYLL
jgi:hypothetical protein